MHVQTEDELLGEDWLDNYATEILDAKCNKTDVNDVVNRIPRTGIYLRPNKYKPPCKLVISRDLAN